MKEATLKFRRKTVVDARRSDATAGEIGLGLTLKVESDTVIEVKEKKALCEWVKKDKAAEVAGGIKE